VRPAISTKVLFFWFPLNHQVIAETVHKFEAGTACLSRSPTDLNKSKLSPYQGGHQTTGLFKLPTLQINQKIQILLSLYQATISYQLNIFTSAVSYQKDERAKPRDLLMK
jgi:hypothetical protein